MFVVEAQLSRGEIVRAVQVPQSYGGPDGCVAVVVRRAGGVYGWWRDAFGNSPGWVSRDLLSEVAAVAWPGEVVFLGA